VIRPFQLGKINVLTWDVLNGRICRFAERQGIAGIGNHTARDRHNDASGIALDENRMIWTWKLGLLFFHVLVSPFRSCSALLIPVIHGSGKVHEEEQRDVHLCAGAAGGEATVREANAGGLNELGRRGVVRVVTHKKSPFVFAEQRQRIFRAGAK